MTDTPRTDNALNKATFAGDDLLEAVIEVASQLERENVALKVELDIWKHRAHRAGFAELRDI